jgi:hypothetical protein
MSTETSQATYSIEALHRYFDKIGAASDLLKGMREKSLGPIS